MESQFFIQKHKRVLLLVIIFLILFLIFLILFILQFKEVNNFVDSNDHVVSAPTTEELKISRDKYKLKNTSLFSFDHRSNLYTPECSPESYPKVEINVDSYAYNIPENNFINQVYKSKFVSIDIFKELSKYAHNHFYISNGQEAFDLVLNGNVALEKIPSLATYTLTMLVPCTSANPVPAGYLQKINFPLTDSAYVLIFFGSSQSLTAKSFMPIYINIISKIEEDYALISLNEIEYQLLSKNNELENCEKKNGIYATINIFEEESKKCVIDELSKNLDLGQVNLIVQELLELFKIQPNN